MGHVWVNICDSSMSTASSVVTQLKRPGTCFPDHVLHLKKRRRSAHFRTRMVKVWYDEIEQYDFGHSINWAGCERQQLHQIVESDRIPIRFRHYPL